MNIKLLQNEGYNIILFYVNDFILFISIHVDNSGFVTRFTPVNISQGIAYLYFYF